VTPCGGHLDHRRQYEEARLVPGRVRSTHDRSLRRRRSGRVGVSRRGGSGTGTNAPGADNSGNRNREYVKIQNTTGAPLNVEGWAIHDGYQNAAGDFSNGYTLRGVNLPAGSPFRGAGADSTVPTDDQFVIPTGGTVTVYNGERFGGRWMWSDATRLVIYRDFKHVYNNGGDKITVANGDTSITSADYSPYRVRLG